MSKFVLGLALGLVVGLSATAAAANIVGLDSFLSGWDVLKKNELVCKDPWVNVAQSRIECS
jgi:hypothetical protein